MTRPRRPIARLAIGATAGAGYGLAQVGFAIWPLVFVCFAGLWIAIDRARPREAFAGSLVFGLAAYGVAMSWLAPTIARFAGGATTGLGFLLWTVHGLWIASGFAAAGAAFAALRRRGAPAALVGPATLVTVEWLQPHVFSAGAGEALVHAPALAQLAELGGPLGLTLFVALVNASGFEAAGARDRARAVRWIAAGLVLVGVAGSWGQARSDTWRERATQGPPLRVGVVQANLSGEATRVDATPGHRVHLDQSLRLLHDGPLDLIVWPESAYARALPRPLPLDGRAIRGAIDAPILFGANSALVHGGRRAATNSVFLVTPDDAIDQVYDKQHLIPFAEYVPKAVPRAFVERWLPRARRFVAGPARRSIEIGAQRITTPICYEIAHARFVRERVAAERATLIVTVADDAWFGRSREPAMHLALARLRAIETRRWIVRATQTGHSAIIDPTGRVRARTPLFERHGMRATVHGQDGSTFYVRAGDWPGPLALVGLAAGLVRRGPRAKAGGDRACSAAD